MSQVIIDGVEYIPLTPDIKRLISSGCVLTHAELNKRILNQLVTSFILKDCQAKMKEIT